MNPQRASTYEKVYFLSRGGFVPKGRRSLVPAPGFGKALYDLLLTKRRPNGTVWIAEDLAEELGVSPKQVRAWLTGDAVPRADTFMAIAQVFDVSADRLWPTRRPPNEGGVNDAHPDDDQSRRVAQGKRQLPSARAPKPNKPHHRRSG